MKKLKLLSVVLAMFMALTFVFTACGDETGPKAKTYTYSTYTSVSPSNWNELTYQDNNDTQIMSYIGSNLFEFDFKFDANGEIVPGDFEVEYSFATALEDVSADFGHEENSGMAWKITIRDDGKWDDGTAITAADFEYTMKEQLNPLFKNYRADSFYNSSTVIVNAFNYVFQGSYAFKAMVSADYLEEEYFAFEDLTEVEGVAQYAGKDVAIDLASGGNWGSNGLLDYAGAGYFDAVPDTKAALVAISKKEHNFFIKTSCVAYYVLYLLY